MPKLTQPGLYIYIYGSILSLSKINSQTHTKSKSTDKKPYIHPEIGGGYKRKEMQSEFVRKRTKE